MPPTPLAFSRYAGAMLDKYAIAAAAGVKPPAGSSPQFQAAWNKLADIKRESLGPQVSYVAPPDYKMVRSPIPAPMASFDPPAPLYPHTPALPTPLNPVDRSNNLGPSVGSMPDLLAPLRDLVKSIANPGGAVPQSPSGVTPSAPSGGVPLNFASTFSGKNLLTAGAVVGVAFVLYQMGKSSSPGKRK